MARDTVLEKRPLCTLAIMTVGVNVEDLKSRNTSISQWASAVRSGRGVLSVTRGLEQPPTSCFPLPVQVSVHPEWLFQPPHLDAGTELERDSIDSLFRWPFINSVGLEARRSSSLDCLSPGGVPAIEKKKKKKRQRQCYPETDTRPVMR